jgi:hypothetical protein
MKLKKGSAEAKRFMASIRAKKKGAKKVSGVKKTATKKAPTKKTASTHKDSKSHNVRISVISAKPTNAQNYNIDKYIKLQNEVLELRKWIINNKKLAKKLTGTVKKMKLMDINFAEHDLYKAKMDVQSFKKFYKTL